MNPKAGSARKVLEALSADDRFEIREVEPDKLIDTVSELAHSGTPRILIAGGDGTLASAATALVDSPAEMAILPGGTLNHFAKRVGVPEDYAEALEVAVAGDAGPQDVGTLNDRVFLNTSSIGAYVLFVRTRDRLEEKYHLPYHLASLLAAFRMLTRLDTISIEIDVEGRRMEYETSMLFVGIGEREIKGKSLGQLKDNGRPGLHILVVQGKARARLFAIALAAATRGRRLTRGPHVDDFLVESCRIRLPGTRRTVATDGELRVIDGALTYTYRSGALNVVTGNSGTR